MFDTLSILVLLGKRSFVYLGSQLWNSLPIGIKDAISLKKELSHGMEHVIVHNGTKHRI